MHKLIITDIGGLAGLVTGLFIAAILLLFIIVSVTGGILMTRVHREMRRMQEPKFVKKPVLWGRYLGAQKDSSGLSRVYVMDDTGQKFYGFSTLSIDELNRQYEGKGFTEIHLTSAPDSHVEADYWDGF